MIIDIHYHVLVEDWFPEAWWNTVAQMYARAIKAIMGLVMTVEGVKQNIIDSFWILTHPDTKRLARKGLLSALY